MASLTSVLTGTTQIIVELTRSEAGKQLVPPVTERTVRTYLDLASLFLPPFYEFRDENLGGLNRFTKISIWHLPILQRIRNYARTKGMKQLRIRLAKDPQYFLMEEKNNDSQHQTDDGEGSSSEVQPTTAQAA
ncbi:MAG: hypothetical protein KME46_21885 [Brasilonema angustatum HA4187-MV1]|nr:hypothetical protein [Brasilonema angustatum HA4187-MV1]